MTTRGRKTNKNRARSASPLINKDNTNKPNKKPNLTQTEDSPPTASSSNTSALPETMELDTTPLETNKGKNPEVIATTILDVDEAYDASENYLNEQTTSVQAFDRPKPSFHAFFPLDDLPGKTPQAKVSFIIDLIFDKYDSFTGANVTKHPENQLKIVKISFRNKEHRDHACSVQLPNMDNRTFSPLEIIPIHPYVPAQSIKVTEIPLDATEHRIKTVFSKFGKIVRFSMNTKNMWQQATITFDANTNFKGLKQIFGTFILNDMVRVHMCDLTRIDILARSKFSAKLAGLPRFTNGKQLVDIGRMLNATSWIILRARSNYQNLQHVFFYFSSADDVEAALSNENLTIDKKHVTWTRTDAKLCAICSEPNHKVNDCPRK